MLKKIGIAIAFLVPATLGAVALIFILLAIDYGPDPGVEVGTTLWGTWALLCGYYFKSSRFKQGGIALLVLAVISLFMNLESAPSQLAVSQEPGRAIEQSSLQPNETISNRQEVLLRTADEINSQLPMMVDSTTRLDSTIALTNRFQYNYTLVSLSSEGIDEQSLLQKIETKIINQACTLEDDLSFLKVGVAMDYVYRANDGVRIATISVSPDDCGY